MDYVIPSERWSRNGVHNQEIVQMSPDPPPCMEIRVWERDYLKADNGLENPSTWYGVSKMCIYLKETHTAMFMRPFCSQLVVFSLITFLLKWIGNFKVVSTLNTTRHDLIAAILML